MEKVENPIEVLDSDSSFYYDVGRGKHCDLGMSWRKNQKIKENKKVTGVKLSKVFLLK